MNEALTDAICQAVHDYRDTGGILYDAPYMIQIVKDEEIDEVVQKVRKEQKLEAYCTNYLKSILVSNVRLLIREMVDLDPKTVTDSMLKTVVKNHDVSINMGPLLTYVNYQRKVDLYEFEKICQLFTVIGHARDVRGYHNQDVFYRVHVRIHTELMPDLASMSRTLGMNNMTRILTATACALLPVGLVENIMLSEEPSNLFTAMVQRFPYIPYLKIRDAQLKAGIAFNSDSMNRLIGLCLALPQKDWTTLTYKDIRDDLCFIMTGIDNNPVTYEAASADTRRIVTECAKIVVERLTELHPHYDIENLRGWFADDWHTVVDSVKLLNLIRQAMATIKNEEDQ